ncbi:hypothetical protein Mapa_011938 [Marchantia paleacea]|nr:hypothetical protein Mapa_011938 [Marchantia paleacea]
MCLERRDSNAINQSYECIYYRSTLCTTNPISHAGRQAYIHLMSPYTCSLS